MMMAMMLPTASIAEIASMVVQKMYGVTSASRMAIGAKRSVPVERERASIPMPVRASMAATTSSAAFFSPSARPDVSEAKAGIK